VVFSEPNLRPSWWRFCDALVVLATTLFVAWKLHPDLLLTSTITTGGDTASHYYTAWWLRYELLPQGRVSGWVPGNYAGFPLFQVYFPLPFVLMAALSLVIGLPVAFKLVTAAGLLLLPAAAYVCFRLLGFSFPAPALAALATVPFLFHEADSMWGANVGSTLAGEFTYSFATVLLLVFAGTLYRGVASGRGWVGNGVLLAAIGLSHAYTLLVAGALGAYLVLLDPHGRRALPYLAKVATLAFGLIAFWLVPLLAFAEYTTAYSIVWPIQGLAHVFPPILWPGLVLLVAGVVAVGWRRWQRRRQGTAADGFDHRVAYLGSLVAGGVFLYLVAWKLDVVDIRFLPFVQLTLALLAALPAAAAIRALTAWRGQLPRPATAGVALFVLTATTLVWTETRIAFVDDWAAWNYSGFEATPGWPAYREVAESVRRSAADPRVAYEHSSAHNDAGTIRAFESLPLFVGASTLEGVYMQSTISSPFVFYIQSEISQIGSCPLLPYHCARLDADRAAEHLRLFNVSEVIARGDRVSEALAASPEFTLVAEADPYRVFRVEGNNGAYVEPLRFEPLVLASDDWKRDFFAWFKRPGSGGVPLLRDRGEERPAPSWQRVTSLPDSIPRRPLRGAVEVTSELAAEEIRIRTSRPGHPLLVKVSYHPRWRVEGAEAVWLASPSFMLVVPTESEVTLVYGRAAADRWGLGLTMMAVLVVVSAGVGRAVAYRRDGREGDSGRFHGDTVAVAGWASSVLDRTFRYRNLWAPALLAALAVGAVSVRWAWTDPWVPHRQGLELFQNGDYEGAELLLLRSIEAAPSSTAAYYSAYYHSLCAYRTRRWEETLLRFTDFIRDYPDGELVAEAHFRVAEAFQGTGRTDEAAARWRLVLEEFPGTQWADLANEKLSTLSAGRTAAPGPAEAPGGGF